MWTVERLLTLSIGAFVLQLLLHIVINPRAIWKHPGTDGLADVVAQNGSRAIALFAVVLVVANFVLDTARPLGPEQTFALALTLTAGGFLMIAFILELFATLSILFLRVQEDSLSYAGVLLFSGLYFVVRAAGISTVLEYTILLFVFLAWFAWLSYKAIYLKVQLKEWQSVDDSRCSYLSSVVLSDN